MVLFRAAAAAARAAEACRDAAIRCNALPQADKAGRAEDHQHDHERGKEHQVIALPRSAAIPAAGRRSAAPMKGPKKRAGTADDHHQQHQERRSKVERRRVDELDQRRIERAGKAAHRPRRSRKRAAYSGAY